MDINLNNSKWKIKGFWPNIPFMGKSIEVGNTLLGVTDWIEATVPGGVHNDLLRAGLIENPHFELNSLKCEWVENRWWMYRTSYEVPKNLLGKQLSLIFKGVDYKAHFYINGEKLGEHEGMYQEIRFDISEKVKFNLENELIILLENAPEEMAQIGFTSKTKTQKSRFNYKWDFSTRMVNIGIWDDVYIHVNDIASFEDTFITSGMEKDKGYISISTTLNSKLVDNFTFLARVELNGESICKFQKNQADAKINEKIMIDDPNIWFPNGMGSQTLYKVTIQLLNGNVLSDQEEYYIGIRTMEYRQNQNSPIDSLPYTFVVNGVPVYIKGVNLTPFDLMYGNVLKETYDQYFNLLKYANINMVRVWGGGLIEKEYFYHLCDLNGIMVWQEFIQSSSGIDNIPSEDEHFLELLKLTAIQAVKTKRNHVCHTLWSGGNELSDKNGVPVDYENKNIRLLMDVVKSYDPDKLFLPTSASGPNEFLNIEQPGKNHDVHGSWKYEGTEKHYTVYNKSDSLFHSEFGVDGMSSYDSLTRFLSQDQLKVSNMTDNLVWRHHGEWWDTYSRDKEIFGDLTDLNLFSKVSQFMQAEGLRYALEANRRRKFNNSGSIIWQFNEPWPNVSNTCIVDYYKTPKMAYYWVKKAYESLHASLAYDRLNCSIDEEFKAKVFLHNSLEKRNVEISWEILDAEGRILYEDKMNQNMSANNCIELKKIKIKIPPLKYGIFFVRLKVLDNELKVKSTNLYTFSQENKEIFSKLLEIKAGKLEIKKVIEGYSIKNSGSEICCFVHGKAINHPVPLYIEKNFESLFPGEEGLFKVEELENGFNNESLIVNWDYLNN